MKRDIQFRPVEYMGIAIVKSDIVDDVLWDVYLFNFQDITIRNVLVASRGYGHIGDNEVETTTLRHFYDDIKALEYVKIEPLHQDLFTINNEYWVSFQANDYLYDKKFVIEPNSVKEEAFTLIPFLNKLGVMFQ
jgi:hypothetical protein